MILKVVYLTRRVDGFMSLQYDWFCFLSTYDTIFGTVVGHASFPRIHHTVRTVAIHSCGVYCTLQNKNKHKHTHT